MKPGHDLIWVYMTAPNREEARLIARELVTARLAAGINIFDRVESFFWWQGRVREQSEVVLVAESRQSLFQRLVQTVKNLHSYECPCILSLKIQDGYDPFLAWMRRELNPEESL